VKILALADFGVDVFPESGKILAGGNSLNLAVNCAKAGAEAFVCGNIGKDKYGEIIKQAMDKYKINREKIYEVEGQTASTVIHIDAGGDRYFKEGAWTAGVWADYKISARDKLFARNMDAAATTIHEPDFENILNVKSGALLLSVDFHDEKINPKWERYFSKTDLFFISGKNQNSKDFRKQLKEWSEKYQTVFIATLGENGSIAYKSGVEFICPAVKVEKVIDTTGCGDSYQAGFILEYLKNKNVLSAMQNGSKLAAETLSFIGGF
jgi:fructoselysine 6-kinase